MSPRSATQDWQRLADKVVARRTSLGMTQQSVQAAGGPSVATMRLIEGGQPKTYRGTILGRLEKALQWQSGSVDSVLEGGDPIEAASASAEAKPSPPGHPLEATPLETPRWFASEAERRGWDAGRLTIDQLRLLAQYFDYSLAELMLNAGLASERDLEIEERPTLSPASEALMDFDAAMKRVAESPFLSRRQRKEAEEFAERTRGEAVKKIRGSKPSRPSDDTP